MKDANQVRADYTLGSSNSVNNTADKKLIKQFEMQLMNGLKSQG